jgi:RNA polymerase sigma factor (sigma-70 family)
VTKRSQTELYGEILTNEQAYSHDLSEVVVLNGDEEQQFLVQARKGDERAKEVLLLSLACQVRKAATRIYRYVRASDPDAYRIEYLDLVQVGNEALFTKWENALSKESPISYLVGNAVWCMRNYAHRYARAIASPPNSHNHLDTPSLDASFDDQTENSLEETLAEKAPVSPTYTDDQLEGLHDALARMVTSQQRNWLIRLYGLYGHAPETGSEIARADKVCASLVCVQRSSAIKRLRNVLIDPTTLRDVYTCEEICQMLGITKENFRKNVVRRYGLKPVSYGLYSRSSIDGIVQAYRSSNGWASRQVLNPIPATA